MATWYAQDFNGLVPGYLLGQDGWLQGGLLQFLNTTIEMFRVSSTYPVSSGQSLACEARPRTGIPPLGLSYIRHPLERHDDALGHTVEFKYKLVQAGAINHIFQLRMLDASVTSYILVINGNGLVRLATWDPINNVYLTVTLTTISVGTTHTFRIEVVNSALTLLISGTPIFTGFARFPMGDQLYLMLFASGSTAFYTKAAIDDLVLEYTPPILAAPSIPLPPANVIVNPRANYNVLSWDGVKNGYVQEIITRGPTGDYSDSVNNTGLSASPIVLQAVISGNTTKKAADLPVEGDAFTVDRFAGTITWSTTSTKRPDFDTPYTIRYEVPITNVTGYRIYRSILLNEFDRELYATVTGYDAGNQLDTALIDTDLKESLVYRIAAVNEDMVESEMSAKVTAIKTSSQIDDKTEVVDRKLFTLDQGLLDEGILR